MALMASLAEQRRFLRNIDKISLDKLNLIAEDLMTIIRSGISESTDVEFHKQVTIEIAYRMQTRI